MPKKPHIPACETPKNAVEAIANPVHEALRGQGITPEMLAKKLKQELNAEETKTLKYKGIIDQSDLPRGFKIIGTGQDEDGNTETHVMYNVVSWRTQQEARKDAHKLRGDYPAEKHDVDIDGELNINIVKFSDIDNGDN